MRLRRICLVTPGHLASNPRLVKEADALQAAGYQVHVVAGRYYPALDPQDREIHTTASWSHTVVDSTMGAGFVIAKMRRALTRRVLRAGAKPTLSRASWAHHAAVASLAAAAVAVKADLYIGHCLAGLAAAASAARKTRARYGFDAEDFHSAETETVERDPHERAIVTEIERALLPGCTCITAASTEIARAYHETYRLSVIPTTLLNVFPSSHAPVAPHAGTPAGQAARLYWFSQTIGPGRGLESLVQTLGLMKRPCSLHLRGLTTPLFSSSLERCAREAGYHGEIEWLPFSSPAGMVRLAAGYDLGLSLEQTTPRNRDLCLTNKIFTYLLAGIPVALTPTTAQNALIPVLGPAAVPLDLSRPLEAAAILDNVLGDCSRRTFAWQLGRDRYNWEREQRLLLAVIARALS